MASYRSGPKRIWLPAAALVLGAGLWFLVARGPRIDGEFVLQPTPNAFDNARPASAASIERAPGAQPEATPNARDAASVAQPTREVAPASTRRLLGRVIVPDGTPPDESASVVLAALVNGQRLELRAPLDASYGFALEVPSPVRHATLDLSAHYLFLDRPLRIDLARVRGEIRLEALLGGSLLVQVVDQQGLVPEGAPGASFELPSRGRSATIDRHGRALFEGLAPGAVGPIVCQVPEHLSPIPTPGAHVRACERAVVEWLLLRSASVSGWVTDSTGSPREGILIHVQSRVDSIRTWAWEFAELDEEERAARSDTSDTHGRFELRGLRPGKALLYAYYPPHESEHLDLGLLVEGERRAGIELVLDARGSIAGTLTWPDGRPAEGITVHAVRRGGRSPLEGPAQRAPGEEHDALGYTSEGIPHESNPATRYSTSNHEGTFEVLGLRPERYELLAQAGSEGAVRADPGDSLQLDAAAATTRSFRARLEDIAPGDPPVTLILRPYP